MAIASTTLTDRLDTLLRDMERRAALSAPSLSFPSAPTRPSIPAQNPLAGVSKKDVYNTSIEAGNNFSLVGYASKWFDDFTGEPYVDSYLDIVEPGAFANSIVGLQGKAKAKGTPYLLPFLWQHSKDDVIGGVTHMNEDTTGLYFETKLAKGVQRAEEAYKLAQMGILGVSYGYEPVRYMPEKGRRRLLEIKLYEISSVTFPAHEGTTLRTKQSKNALLNEMREIKRLQQSIEAHEGRMDAIEQKMQRLIYQAGTWIRGLEQAGYVEEDRRARDLVLSLDDWFNDVEFRNSISRGSSSRFR